EEIALAVAVRDDDPAPHRLRLLARRGRRRIGVDDRRPAHTSPLVTDSATLSRMPASPVLGAPSVLTFMLAASTLALSACGPAPQPSGAAGEPEKPAPTASAPAADASP